MNFDIIISSLQTYLESLEWYYIWTFILLSYFLVKDELLNPFKPQKWAKMLLKVSKIYRVGIVGMLYGAFYFWVNGFGTKADLQNMISSFTFTIVFHKMALDKLIALGEAKFKTNSNESI